MKKAIFWVISIVVVWVLMNMLEDFTELWIENFINKHDIIGFWILLVIILFLRIGTLFMDWKNQSKHLDKNNLEKRKIITLLTVTATIIIVATIIMIAVFRVKNGL